MWQTSNFGLLVVCLACLCFDCQYLYFYLLKSWTCLHTFELWGKVGWSRLLSKNALAGLPFSRGADTQSPSYQVSSVKASLIQSQIVRKRSKWLRIRKTPSCDLRRESLKLPEHLIKFLQLSANNKSFCQHLSIVLQLSTSRASFLNIFQQHLVGLVGAPHTAPLTCGRYTAQSCLEEAGGVEHRLLRQLAPNGGTQ